MLRKEFKNMRVYNPFSDEYEDLDCEFECHIDSHNNLDHVDTASIISKGGVELYDYLDQKVLEAIANDFLNEWGDLV